MTILKFKSAIIILIGIIIQTAAVSALTAQIIYQPNPDSPIGERNAKAPVEAAQFDFVIGDWDVEITFTPPQGNPSTYSAKWHNHWINNGFDVMQEWRGPYASGSEIRHYNTAQEKWVGMNLYSGANSGWSAWKRTTANMVGENMVVIIEASNPQDGEFLNRETYFQIADNSWRMKSERSFDDGETWVVGRYIMTAVRASTGK